MKAVLRYCAWIGGLILLSTQAFAATELLSVNTKPISDGMAVIFHFSAAPNNVPEPKALADNVLQLSFPAVTLNTAAKNEISIDSKVLNLISLNEATSSTAAMVKLSANLPYEMSQQGNDVILSVHMGEKASANEPNIINNIQFKADNNGAGVLSIQLANNKVHPEFVEQARTLIVNIPNVQLASKWISTMNVAEFKTIVSSIKATNTTHGASFTITTTVPYILQQDTANNTISLVLQSKQKAEMNAEDSTYTGKRLSLNFQNISVRSVIQIIADFTGINMVTSDSVQGNITLRLKDVPWDQALDIVLKARGLSQRRVGNVIYIGPAAEVAAQEKAALEEQAQSNALAPLTEEYFRLSYAQAPEMAGILQSKQGGFLGPRGTVTVDTRTNTLLVRDTAVQIAKIQKLIAHLDVAVPQILIEARIVRVTQEGVQELGVTTLPPVVPGTVAPGSLTPALNPTASAGGYNAQAQGFINNGLADISGGLGLSITGLPAGMNLNLELQALETEGNGKVISSPQLTVSDKQEAYIQQGSEIPYNESTSSGAAAISFKKAVLSLRVTPQITPDGNIAMKLNVTNDSPSNTQVGAQNIPLINTSEITTQVLVKNGETIVLGGIQVETKDHQVRRIPFLGDLPGVGWLFKSTKDHNKTDQLLIFLTPKIINSPGSV